MELILQNPFRVLGLTITATERQITKRIDDLTLYSEMGKAKSYDTDLSFLSTVIRTPETIQLAASQLVLADSRLFYSSFWFHSHNSIDELIMELLTDGNVTKARELWKKALTDGVTVKNCQNARNLSLLTMSTSKDQTGFNEQMLIEGAKQFVDSYLLCFSEIRDSVNDQSIKTSASDILTTFSKTLYETLAFVADDRSIKLEKSFIKAFSSADENVFSNVKDLFITDDLREITKAIDECVETRSSEKSMSAATNLYSSVKNKLKRLKEILGPSDLHYLSSADKVSAELMKCSTAHFNASIETTDTFIPHDESEKITKWAKLAAASQSQKSAAEKDLQIISDLRKSKRTNRLSDDIGDLLRSLIEQNKSRTDKTWIPGSLSNFFSNIEIPLSQLGQLDSTSRDDLSDLIANVALSLIISHANQCKAYSTSVNLLVDIRKFAMTPETNNKIRENILILSENEKIKKSNSGGCYVATLAYGDYDDPQVMKLRKFRDNFLSARIEGRLFIRLYYLISPYMVKLLRNQTSIHGGIRHMLDKLIQTLEL